MNMVIKVGHNNPLRHYLREWRESKHLTQEQVAERLETSKGQVSNFENNKRKMTVEMANAFAFALGIDPLSIFHHPDQPSADALLRNAPAEDRIKILTVIKTLLDKAA